jgi:hypothetical protein
MSAKLIFSDAALPRIINGVNVLASAIPDNLGPVCRNVIPVNYYCPLLVVNSSSSWSRQSTGRATRKNWVRRLGEAVRQHR